MDSSLILCYIWWISYLELLLVCSILLMKTSLKVTNEVTFVCCIMLALYSVFAITTSDWIAYNDIIKEQIRFHGTAATNLESFWIRLILFLKNNISFRCS